MIKVIQPGLQTTVQDKGRIGYYEVGMPPSGVMDKYSFVISNLLIGNDENASVLEITYMGPVLEFDVDDLHNPTGCWNPTFKASYNDINTLVQFAIKHINLRFEKDKALRNFVIESDDKDCLTIKLKEF